MKVIFEDGAQSVVVQIQKARDRALMRSAIVLQSNIKAECPIGDTGNLRRSITEIHPNDGDSGAYTNTVYAARVNYGFKGADILGRIFHQEPNPFFERGAEASKRAIHNFFREELGQAINVKMGMSK